ncbi:hypothetical protein A9Q84_15040 [Halobacteriovorax marinus]|uniref:DUF2268 domain-containing protein n=1 Tax=Halobacteriovorax marinus TaxID=97084 RepID=A0A1Y5FB02_9BACT|nr:hypothetical protein A9Q84_15040 [Halobacteriovorax marinus]
MKFLLVLTFLTFVSASVQAAVCSCGAPASCGPSRPPRCPLKEINKDLSKVSKFYANHSIQDQKPAAFALNSKSSAFVLEVSHSSTIEADRFINMLRENQSLIEKIESFASLTAVEQVPVLKEVFALEVKALEIKAPKLVIDLTYERAAFFEFDVNSNEPGVVYINPLITFKDSKYAALSLLIHETRHSAQLQLAQNENREVLGSAYHQAFVAQKFFTGKLGFSDFLTLNNEYEAFLFGNYVMNKLFMGRVDLIDMGTFASQFNEAGDLKIDLSYLHLHHSESVLETFNELEKVQAKLLGVE